MSLNIESFRQVANSAWVTSRDITVQGEGDKAVAKLGNYIFSQSAAVNDATMAAFKTALEKEYGVFGTHAFDTLVGTRSQLHQSLRAMDVKNVPEKYAETVGIPGFDPAPVRESVSLLLSGSVEFEFRTTVVSPFHTIEDIEGIARWIRGTKRYFLQNFVDSGSLVGHASAVPRDTLFAMRDRAAAIIPSTALRGVD